MENEKKKKYSTIESILETKEYEANKLRKLIVEKMMDEKQFCKIEYLQGTIKPATSRATGKRVEKLTKSMI